MKRIGILGGMSPEASIDYYRRLIDLARERWPYKCPEIVVFNLDLERWKNCVEDREPAKALAYLREGLAVLHGAGADFAIMASNTPHMFLDRLAAASPLPIISIVKETAKEAGARGFAKVGLLGTAMVMEGRFYAEPFTGRGVRVAVPCPEERRYVHGAIVDHLVRGDFRADIVHGLAAVAKRLAEEEGIQALVLGCTELPLVLDEERVGMPVLNTSLIHVRAAFDRACRE
ncbi:MAG: amino acid racemase [Bacillota bacterium]|nr:amino acid racemase [Bacillota bacterium]